MSPRDDIYVGIDIGSSKIAVVAGQYQEEKGWDIIGVGKAEAAGLRKGAIVNIEETISDFSAALEQAERMAGCEFTHAVFGVGEANTHSITSKGVVAISRPDGEITEEDVERVVEASKAVSVPTNFEILHVISKSFTVDGQEDIVDPVGMTGIRLEVDTHIILSSTPALKNLRKCAEQLNLRIDSFTYSALASGEMLLSKQDKDIGAAVVDIGSHTCELAVFEQGNIVHTKVIPVGSNHITNDLAIGLRTSLPVAEQIKLDYADAVPGEITENKDVNLKKYDTDEDQEVGRKFIAEICEARLVEIFSLIKKELKSIGKDGTLASGVVLAGGGAKIPHICELAKNVLKLPARVGKPQAAISGLVDKLSDPIYTCSTGLLMWGLRMNLGKSKFNLPINFSGFDRAGSKMKSWFRNFIP